MITRLVVGMVALALVTAFAPAPIPKDPTKSAVGLARKLLQGNWQVKFVESSEEVASFGTSSLRVGTRVRIAQDRWVTTSSRGKGSFGELGRGKGGPKGKGKSKGSKGPPGGVETTFVPNPQRSPAWLDLHAESGGKVQMRGIYRLEGDLLKFCYFSGRSDDTRPECFFPVPEGATFVILERVITERKD